MTRDEIVLEYSLWGMDDTPYRILRNVMATTRKPSQCAVCMEAIPAGTLVRAQSEVYDGHAKTFRICVACQDAIVLDSVDGDSLHMERRTQIGMGMAVAALDPHASNPGKPSTRVVTASSESTKPSPPQEEP